MLIEVSNDSSIRVVAELARAIWPEHYNDTVGKPQIDYMLNKFQSSSSIKQQIDKEGYKYYLLNADDQNIGYLSFKIEPDSIFISKLYLLKNKRGKGYGKKMLDFIIEHASKIQLSRIYLTVNKLNLSSTGFYLNQGFQIKEDIIIDIGNGFVMDDHKMVLDLD